MIIEEKLIESIIRIENFVLENYKDCQDPIVFETICSTLGLKKLLKNNKDLICKSLQLYLFSKFISKFSINFDELVKSFKIEQLRALTGRIGVSTNEAINPAIITAGKTYVSNFVKQFGDSTIVETQIPEVDNYFKYSVVVRKLYAQIDTLNDLAKLQFVQVVRYLVSKTEFIRSLIRKQNGTRFKVNNQDILSDYFYELETSNLKINKIISKLDIVPYLLELNGKPGVGKSTFVDYFSELIQQLLPFYSGAEILYTRVNDKFWNGYKQQPLVLYDDSNQNKKLLYDLDNEIIMIGGGKFVYPPMAFEKDTKFSSIFVIYTTNKPILKTTKVDKGAIARRINTYTVRPIESLGSWQQSDLGEYWQYNDDVIESPFNITFNNMNYLTIFSKLILKQMDKLSKKNVSTCPFSILQQTRRQVSVETIEQRLNSYRKYLGLDNKYNKVDEQPFNFEDVPQIEFVYKKEEIKNIGASSVSCVQTCYNMVSEEERVPGSFFKKVTKNRLYARLQYLQTLLKIKQKSQPRSLLKSGNFILFNVNSSFVSLNQLPYNHFSDIYIGKWESKDTGRKLTEDTTVIETSIDIVNSFQVLSTYSLYQNEEGIYLDFE